MKQIKHIAFIMLVSMPSINCFAYDIAVGGIYYNYINEGKELAVTYRTRPEHNEAAYSGYGSIDIPSEVTYAGRTREVTAIGDSAFYRTYRPDKITIPNSVKYIGMYAFWGCTCDLVFGNGVKSIGGDAFYSFGMSGDNKLSGVKVIINDIAAWCNISFGDSPLQWGAKLYYNDENTIIEGDIVIPDGTTSIGNWAIGHFATALSHLLPFPIP